MISGPQKIGLKTWLALGLAYHVAAGKDFLGLAIPKRRKVLYINCEVGEDAFRRRVHALHDVLPPDEPASQRLRMMHLRGCGVDFSQTRATRALLEEVETYGIKVVIIDPITEAIGIDENDPVKVARLLKGLQDDLANRGVTVVLVHHWPKTAPKSRRQTGTIARGAAKWAEHQDTNIQSHPTGEGRIELHFETRNCESPKPVDARLDGGALLIRDGVPLRAPVRSDDDKILAALRDGCEHLQSDVADKLEFGASKLSKRLSSLECEGKIARRKGDADRDEDPRAKYVRIVSKTLSTVCGRDPRA